MICLVGGLVEWVSHVPGAGSQIAWLESACCRSAVNAGKPEKWMIHYLQETAGVDPERWVRIVLLTAGPS